jgi:cytochrome c biogenesis protein CcmG/thiol:disulfide interchange protein DsbE
MKLTIPAVRSFAGNPSLSAESKTLAPSWQLSDVGGKPVKLSDFKGKVVILDFWATWCPPCRKEISGFVAIQKKYADKGFTVIGVSVDEEGPSAVKPVVYELKVNYPIVVADAKIVSDYGGIEVVPTTFIIDRQGDISSVQEGFTDRATFEGQIQSLL